MTGFVVRGIASLVALGSLMGGTASAAPTGIASVEVHIENGLLGIQGSLSVVTSSPDGAFVYTTSQEGDAVGVFSRDPLTGKLTHVEKETDLGFAGPLVNINPQGLALSPGTGAQLYVASKTGAVTVFDRDTVTGMLTFLELEEEGVGGVTDLNGAGGIVVSPDGDHVYVAAESDDSVVIFDRDSITGLLTFNSSLVDPGNITRPNGMAISPNGLQLYVTGFQDDTLTVYSRDLGTGALTFVEKHQDGVAGVDGIENASSIAMTTDGASVYVVGEGDDGIAIFDRNPLTGELAFNEQALGDLEFVRRPSAVAVTSDGTHVFVASRSRAAVAMFDRNLGNGDLTYVAAEKLQGGAAVTTSPDGLHVYVGTRSDAGLLGVYRLTDIGCTPAPMLGCTTPAQAGKSLLLVKDNAVDAGDIVLWKWSKGPVTPLSAFGDPVTTTTDHVMCVYDDTLGTPQLVFQGRLYAGGACEGKACWKASTTSYKYKDKARSPDGLISAGMKAGTIVGQAQIKVKGKGELLPTPTLPLVTPVVVQLQRPGTCWETTHTTPLVTTSAQFKSKDQ